MSDFWSDPSSTCGNNEGPGETAQMRRLAWAFAGRLCDKYHYLMSWLKVTFLMRCLIWYFYAKAKKNISYFQKRPSIF